MLRVLGLLARGEKSFISNESTLSQSENHPRVFFCAFMVNRSPMNNHNLEFFPTQSKKNTKFSMNELFLFIDSFD